MEVAARRYRFRLLNASVSRFIKLAVVDQAGRPFPFHFIANDGNFVVKPILIPDGILDEQGSAERYDIVIDFAKAKARGAARLYLVNLLQQTNGRKPDGAVSIRQAMTGVEADPAVGPFLEFRIGNTAPDKSADFFDPAWGTLGSKVLTEQVPMQAAVRERTIEFVRSRGDSRNTPDGRCIPDCADIENFPWAIKINGQAAHSLNANRISALIPKSGEVEKWTLVGGGSGDHPIHLHFEEAITLDRGGALIPQTEKLVRKDVWRLRPSGRVSFQVRFGEFGGAYSLSCDNAVHGDFAMLLRYQLLSGPASGDPQKSITPTPIPSENGVSWKTPEILPEGNPV
jgi:FtsP/CotA-like multicopper oxidase with cupredoxin domain